MACRTGGWAGRILRINLTEGRVEARPTNPLAERFIGGLGLAAKIAWDEIRPETRAFDPDNRLILATGPLTGTLAPASGRLEVMAKSPRTYPQEAVTRSGLGGHFGRELKHAGFDAVILEGEAKTPVMVVITADKVDLIEAEAYWGRDTFETQKRIRSIYGSRTECLCIGPAGENRSRLATIMSGTSHCAGKSGFGAVMGAKKVKALIVNGRGGRIRIAHPKQLMELHHHYRDLVGARPIREWTVGYDLPDYHVEFFKKYRKGNASCFGCPVQCYAFIRVPGLDPGQINCVNYYYMGPAYEYYGQTLEADQALWQANILCNKLGLDTFELAGMAPWLRDLFRAGLIDEESSGLPVGRFGSQEFITALLQAIAGRRGLGDILAEGAARAAESLPGAWPLYEKYYPSHGQTEHDSVRSFPGVALLWALDSRDPLIDHHAYRHLSVSRLRWPAPHRLHKKQAEAISEKIFGTKKAIDHNTYAAKAPAVAYCQNRSRLINCLVLCDFLFPVFVAQAKEDRLGDTAAESKLFRAVTGLELCEAELDNLGERVFALERAIMAREGRTRDQDTLHEGYFHESAPDLPDEDQRGRTTVIDEQLKAVPRDQFERAKTEYYHLRGYDPLTGWPTPKTLRRLGLDEVAAEF